MINRYSLTDYKVTITPPEGLYKDDSSTSSTSSTTTDANTEAQNKQNKNIIVIGGAGSAGNNNTDLGTFLGSITVNRTNDAWSTDGDVTGSWVHNQNRSKVGTVSINIKQVSDDIIKLHNLLKIMEKSNKNTKGCTIEITNAVDSDKKLFTCNDCYIVKMPDYVMGETAGVQIYTFTCGQVISEI